MKRLFALFTRKNFRLFNNQTVKENGMENIKFLVDGRKVQRIKVGVGDKYGVAMIAYFKNSMNGLNVKRLEVVDKSKVQLFFDQKTESYVFQLLDFSIGCVEEHYQKFISKYDILIKDKIAHL